MTDVYCVNWNIGAHIGFSGQISNTLESALDSGMYTVQFFLGNPQSYKRTRIQEEDIVKCEEIKTRYPMYIYSHFPYTANFAGKSQKDGLAWNGNTQVDTYLRLVLRELEYELKILSRVGNGVVIHPGSYANREEGLRAIAKSLNKINWVPNSLLLLENCAGEGNKLCRNFAELRTVLDNVSLGTKEHLGCCIDTAHIWGQGDYDLREVGEIDRMFEDFDKIVGMEFFRLLHLNDSEVTLGAKKDRHACLGEGYIWKENMESLVYLLNKCKKQGIPMVLETHSRDMFTLAILSEDTELLCCQPCGAKQIPSVPKCNC